MTDGACISTPPPADCNTQDDLQRIEVLGLHCCYTGTDVILFLRGKNKKYEYFFGHSIGIETRTDRSYDFIAK